MSRRNRVLTVVLIAILSLVLIARISYAGGVLQTLLLQVYGSYGENNNDDPPEATDNSAAAETTLNPRLCSLSRTPGFSGPSLNAVTPYVINAGNYFIIGVSADGNWVKVSIGGATLWVPVGAVNCP